MEHFITVLYRSASFAVCLCRTTLNGNIKKLYATRNMANLEVLDLDARTFISNSILKLILYINSNVFIYIYIFIGIVKIVS